MKLLLIIVLLLLFILLFFILLTQREISKLNQRIKEIDSESNQLVEINLFNPMIDQLTETINQQIMEQRMERIDTVKREQELKETISEISHDLRTPLTAMIGYLQLLERENLSLEQQESIQILLDKSLAMKSLTQAFFELSYYESKTVEPELQQINLSRLLINEVLKEAATFEQRAIEPELEIQEECLIISDEKLLTRILQNVIANALQHGKDQLRIQLTQQDQTVLSFTNKYENDAQIDPERIFQRFYVGSNTRNGHGLGLAIVELLSKKLSIKVAAEVSDTDFTIRIIFPRK
ncbi:sensor histidine kinase [Candidatus Enterococcus murrayae]|uniref:histidine kinase n=1 Tax=Candidatus Enterococcus murrayae TaxID=2815321 RepID=A0ABS3HIH9_9ENTE|nr:HAMP domain-containing sensor histidine kinase [Enterococcus sp. MJM16]MBO0453271.1 HAMP domain-containing histidine kinase [Enterococcus sp. MJM16]